MTHQIFTEAEVAYLRSQLIGRLATVGSDGQPHVTPVGVFYDSVTQAIVVAGHAGSSMATSKKFRDVRQRPQVAFVVDDLASTDPWTPRGIEIRGVAEIFTEGGEELGRRIEATMPFDPAGFRIRPRRIVSRGIDAAPFDLNARDVT